MKNLELVKRTIIPGAIALVVLLLSFLLPVMAEVLLGVGVVSVFLAIFALEYGRPLKALLRFKR